MEGIGQAVLGLLAVGVIVAIAIVLGGVQSRVTTARTGAALAPLVPMVGGTVSDGRLRGTYQGYSVEAWPERHDPSPPSSTDGSASFEVNIFNLKLTGVPGRQYWYCHSRPRLFGAPDFEFTGLLGRSWALEERIGTLTGYPAPDAALEERLRAAGLTGELSRLGVRDSGYLPKVSFAPPPSKERVEQLAPLVLPEAARDKLPHFAGELHCEIEMGASAVPSPEAFREWLDSAVRLARINAEANPPEDVRPGS